MIFHTPELSSTTSKKVLDLWKQITIINLMTTTNAANVAATMNTTDLMHVARVLNAELEAAILAGEQGTQAHFGSIELAQACSDELVARGIVAGVPIDGSHLPVLVQWEDGVVKLSQPVLVF